MEAGVMDHKGIRAFAPRCSMCGVPRLPVITRAPVVDFKFVRYLICQWCDRGNRGVRRQ